ncbi:hypothetical protein Tco_0295322 [Tanacetum coccineum]
MLILKVKSLEIPIHLFRLEALSEITESCSWEPPYKHKQRKKQYKINNIVSICLFLISIEPRKVSEALKMKVWWKAYAGKELLQFSFNKYGSWLIYPLVLSMIEAIKSYVDVHHFGSTKSLGLQVKQNKGGIFISQDKYVAEILKKFALENVKAAITPMETKLPLTKDEEAFDVDVHLYRSMIGNSKDFSSQCCQEDLQVSQGQTKLGLYGDPMEFTLDLESILLTVDYDYCSDFNTEAEYADAANCLVEMLWHSLDAKEKCVNSG